MHCVMEGEIKQKEKERESGKKKWKKASHTQRGEHLRAFIGSELGALIGSNESETYVAASLTVGESSYRLQ